MGERDMLYKVLWVLSPKHWCRSVFASLPQFLDIWSNPRQAVNAVHHAVLLNEFRAALEDLGHCQTKTTAIHHFQSLLSSSTEEDARILRVDQLFCVFSDGKTLSELEWTHMHTESCISLLVLLGCLKPFSVLMQAVCKETVSVWGNQSPSPWLCGRRLKSQKSLVSLHSPSGANTDMLSVYVSLSMEDKDSVYMYEEASPQLTHHFRLTEWDTCWSSCSNSTCSQRENKAIHSMWTNK